MKLIFKGNQVIQVLIFLGTSVKSQILYIELLRIMKIIHIKCIFTCIVRKIVVNRMINLIR